MNTFRSDAALVQGSRQQTGQDPEAARSDRMPEAEDFPAFPASWYLFCTSEELNRGPVGRELFGTRLVGWRAEENRPVVLTGVCPHFGADLSLGDVHQHRLRCPFHHWEFSADGSCAHIPAQTEIPPSAHQRTWPVAERHGFIFVFHGRTPRFELPFFPGCDPDDFLPASPFTATLKCLWFLIGANAFDLQHFRAAHDRRLIETPRVDIPSPFARRASGTFEVAGDGIRDRITRLFAGDRVTMEITDWCGNIMFATATFRRTTSYGMVITEPLPGDRVCVRVIVFLPRSKHRIGRLLDPARRAIRRYFIRKFLSEDASRLDGALYQPGGLIECDRDLKDYFRWLARVSRGDVPIAPDSDA